MPCRVVQMPGGGHGFVCGPRQRVPRCKCGSRKPADLLCDWKLPEGGTCDEKICRACTSVPAPDKDLCRTHAAEWEKRKPR